MPGKHILYKWLISVWRILNYYSAIQIFYEIVEAYKARSVEVYFVRLREQPFGMFKKSGLLYLVGQDHLFRKVSEAIEIIELDISKRGSITA